MNHCPLCESVDTQFFWEKVDRRFGRREYWECNNCFLAYLLAECRLNSIFEKSKYDEHNNSAEDKGYVDFLNRLIIPMSKCLLKGLEGLDFGSGPGPTSCILFKALGFEVKNYDPYYCKDPEVLNQKFDFISCSEVVEHFYNPKKEFELMFSLLKEKGLLGIMTSFRDPKKDFSKWWYHIDPTHVCFYQKETFAYIAKKMNAALDLSNKNVALFKKT